MKQLVELPKWSVIWALIYFLATAILLWGLQPKISLLVYGFGALCGFLFLQIAEFGLFIASTDHPQTSSELRQSPYRNVLVQGVLVVVTFFVLTSTDSLFAKGMVLFINLQYLYLQERSLQQGKLTRWFRDVGLQIAPEREKIYLRALLIVLAFETLLFLL